MSRRSHWPPTFSGYRESRVSIYDDSNRRQTYDLTRLSHLRVMPGFRSGDLRVEALSRPDDAPSCYPNMYRPPSRFRQSQDHYLPRSIDLRQEHSRLTSKSYIYHPPTVVFESSNLTQSRDRYWSFPHSYRHNSNHHHHHHRGRDNQLNPNRLRRHDLYHTHSTSTSSAEELYYYTSENSDSVTSYDSDYDRMHRSSRRNHSRRLHSARDRDRHSRDGEDRRRRPRHRLLNRRHFTLPLRPQRRRPNSNSNSDYSYERRRRG